VRRFEFIFGKTLGLSVTLLLTTLAMATVLFSCTFPTGTAGGRRSASSSPPRDLHGAGTADVSGLPLFDVHHPVLSAIFTLSSSSSVI